MKPAELAAELRKRFAACVNSEDYAHARMDDFIDHNAEAIAAALEAAGEMEAECVRLRELVRTQERAWEKSPSVAERLLNIGKGLQTKNVDDAIRALEKEREIAPEKLLRRTTRFK